MRELIAALADGSIEDRDRKAVMEHVEECVSCRNELERMREAVGILHRGFSRERLVADLTSRVMMYLPEMDPELPACGHESTAGRAESSGYLWAMVAGVAAALLLVAGLTWLTWPEAGNEVNAVLSQPESAGIILGVAKGVTAIQGNEGASVRVAKASYPLETGGRYETGSGEGAVLGLRDGSRISLLERSSLTIISGREIALNSGHACFDITHNGERFRVKTPDGLITVMGTLFGVAVDQGRTTVTVINGLVQVENAQSFVLLSRDEQTEMGAAITTLTVRKNPADVAAWREKVQSLGVDRGLEREWIRVAGNSTVTHPVRAERVFVVDVGSRKVSGLRVEWDPNAVRPKRMGYTIYVRDGSLKPVAKGYIPGHVFAEAKSSSFDLSLPDQVRETGSSLLHISVVPDVDSGVNTTEFTEVYALTEP